MGGSRAGQPLAARLAEMADRAPARVALVELVPGEPPVVMTAGALAEEVLGLAGEMAARLGDDAVICHPATNTIRTATVVLAALCAGVTVFPYPARIDRELFEEALGAAGLRTGRADSVTAVLLDPGGSPGLGEIASWTSRRYTAAPTHLLATSGSTGLPKLTPFWQRADYDPRAVPDPVFRTCGWRSGQNQLLVLPLSHIAPFSALVQGVLDENRLVLGTGLAPQDIAAAIAEHRVDWMMLTPVHLQRLLPVALERPADFDSLRAVVHTALPCPAELKRAWLAALGPERLYEMYGGTEGVGVTVIRGTDWEVRPGSVGRGVMTRIRIVDEHGQEAKPGELGRIYLRRLGAPAVDRNRAGWLRSTPDGFISLGDMGWVDEDGFLFIHDRAANGVSVNNETAWLGRTSAVLRTHPAVLDAECLRHGTAEAITAVVVVRPGVAADLRELARHCADRLAVHERPDWFVQVADIPRSELGKVNRIKLESMVEEGLNRGSLQ
ncbi:AMP-binding protein [Kitasatospora sp. NBC_01287]|uniref:class I adenylate-forming enzyme family protein n=1 Tax=Kitasatospora sp. NBC_01287 TaxID=2903573 RepID=UPI0022560CAF|nr:AMP-binding protein [Kitasatospora sp. NBC_01287]MCX4749344.1 AMP-binding protein [Kitasatospora sp. NBC_01287]